MSNYKLIAFSDSHGSPRRMYDAMKSHRDADMFVHLGDGCGEFLALRSEFPNVMFTAVRGNCDIGVGLPKYDDYAVLGTKRIFLTHGNRYGVQYDTLNLHNYAKENNFHVALYGHTHIKKIEYRDGIYTANPGSISQPRDGMPPSFLIIDVRGDDILLS